MKKMKSSRVKRMVFIIFLIVIFIYNISLSSNSTFIKAEQQPKNILLINSYDSTYTWTLLQTNGILETFKTSYPNSKIYVEYIDWKNNPYSENLDKFKDIIKYKYSNKKIDLVMTTDDAALNFSIKNRSEIFGDIPIVFSGVYEETIPEIIKESNNTYGVIEKIDVEDTIKAALNIYPIANKIYVVHDNTESGTASFKEVKSAVSKLGININLDSINNIDLYDFNTALPNIDKNSIILMTTYARDSTGRTVQHEEVAYYLSKRIEVPIFTVYETGLNHGALGGSVLSGERHGRSAAEIAIKIINGEKISKNILGAKGSVRGIYDNQVMKKFGIGLDKIPRGSEVINKDFSFYASYKHLVWIITGIISLLIIFIVILMRNVVRRKKAENKLIESNYQLSEIYEELSASDEELRDQYIKLEESRDLIQKNEEMYRIIFETANDGLWEIDLETGERYFSDRWHEIFGLTRSEVKTMEDWFSIVHPEDVLVARGVIYDIISGALESFSCDYRITSKDGDYKWIHAIGKVIRDNHGRSFKLVGSHSDIHERKLQEEQIRQMAFFDSLTGLPNRVEIANNFDNLVKNNNKNIAVIFMDIDNFKNINDSFGHTVGDDLLIEVSKRIKNFTRDRGIVARLGGDEFLILLPNIDDKGVNEYISNLSNRLEAKIIINGIKVIASASFGAAVYPRDGENFEDLLKNSDTAMYKSKEVGKRTFTFFEKWMNDNILEMVIMENQLRTALEKDEFILHYQPKISLKDSRIEGFEALIRWNSELLGFVSPLKFISLAEKTGLIIEIGQWVLEKSCEFIEKIHSLGYKDISVSVNVSVVQLLQDDFISMVEDVISKYDIQSKFINLEITESILMESIDKNISKLNKLKEKSISISLDDFGKGYSSLTYLKDMPFDVLKIDKVFIDELNAESISSSNESIVGIIIQLAHHMGLKVVAEGVETEEQYLYLSKQHCDIVQGYFISKPLPENQIADLLKRYNAIN
ncbi:EAL domain-containing protein [Clostridium manihotivorum]|uniref:Diguanylate cyclase n=1 Tax=Clostridium manihotivorum TaxID=2320868 RepID=A0A3R5U3W7_9CLOT|nr:EAL domain-containing protein [Clostridium manihotivorum]QAA31044.1 diguanylate cyclase [Clostridium manihotivorum]